MKKYLLICPKCGGKTIAVHPEAMIWEHCSACLNHSWDTYDVQMAEPLGNQSHGSVKRGAWAGASANN